VSQFLEMTWTTKRLDAANKRRGANGRTERCLLSSTYGPHIGEMSWESCIPILGCNVRKRDVFTKYGPQARAVLEALLQKYQDQGVIDLGDPSPGPTAEPRASRGFHRTSSALVTIPGLNSPTITRNIPVVSPGELAEYFELLVGAYRADASGKLLVHWFREDWAMFQHPRMDDPQAKALLGEILGNGQIVRRRFVPASNPTIDFVYLIWPLSRV
jgi:hypothetical protein